MRNGRSRSIFHLSRPAIGRSESLAAKRQRERGPLSERGLLPGSRTCLAIAEARALIWGHWNRSRTRTRSTRAGRTGEASTRAGKRTRLPSTFSGWRGSRRLGRRQRGRAEGLDGRGARKEGGAGRGEEGSPARQGRGEERAPQDARGRGIGEAEEAREAEPPGEATRRDSPRDGDGAGARDIIERRAGSAHGPRQDGPRQGAATHNAARHRRCPRARGGGRGARAAARAALKSRRGSGKDAAPGEAARPPRRRARRSRR